MSNYRPTYLRLEVLVSTKRGSDVGMQFEESNDITVIKDPVIMNGTRGFKLENHVLNIILGNENMLCHILQEVVILGKLSTSVSFMFKIASLPTCQSVLACMGGIAAS